MEHFKIIIYTLLLVVALSCRHHQKSKSLPPTKVELSTAKSAQIYEQVESATQISALRTTSIIARVDGSLTSISHDLGGSYVERGELLFTIEPTPYNYALLSAKASLESAKAQEQLALSNYQRALPLAQIDAISRSELDQYSATLTAARASVKSATEGLNNAKLNLSYTKIHAPISGIIAESTAEEGDYIAAPTTLTTISYIDSVEVEIPIPTAQYLPSNGTLSDITLTLSGGEIYGHKGEYYYTLRDSPSASSTVVVMVKFPNPDHTLRPGMFGRVRANIGAPKECVVVPQEAVSQSQGVNSVWVMQSDSTVKFTQVKLGKTTSNNEWIIQDGVFSGDKLLVSGQLKVHNGAKVSPINR